MKPILYIVPVPIGNYDDITLRGLKILESVDFIICEEYKPARRLLANFNIENELVSLNEHNEKEVAQDLVNKILSGKSAALISDAGTPLFSDPGHILVDLCISYRIQIIPLPGASSILPALVTSGLDIENFYYFGWLSPKKGIRQKELLKLKKLKELIIIMETPYRLKRLLSDIVKHFGPNQFAVIAYKLTMSEEHIFRDSVKNILNEVERKNLKGEFVLLLDNRK